MNTIYKRADLTLRGVYVLILSLLFVGCEEFSLGGSFLDQTPESTGVDTDDIFGSAFYAEQVLTNSYAQLHYPITYWSGGYDRMGGDFSDAITDMSHNGTTYGGSLNYYRGSYSASTVNSTSNYNFTNSKTWTGIRYAWLMIENVDSVPDMTDSEKRRAKAEAKMLIATHYADMFRHFGGVPILDHAITTADDLTFPRATAQQTLDFIIGLIDEAIPDLEWRVSDNNDDGRMTAGYARGLKLRVLLFAASPLFNSDEPYMTGSDELTWLGGYDASRWDDVVTAGEEFFAANNDVYYLNPAATEDETGYRKAFRDAYFTRANPEMLLSIRRAYKNTYSSSFCSASDDYAGKQAPTLKLFNLYPNNDGSDFSFDLDSDGKYIGTYGSNPFTDRDPRLYETILMPNVSYKSRLSQLWVGGEDRVTANESTGFELYKFSQDYTTATSIGQIDCYPAMRLPEVMLSYAEALNEVNGGPTTTAVEQIVAVRARVGLSKPTQAQFLAMSQSDFREYLLDERAREFAYEDVRWFDIVRRKMVECFTTEIQGLNMRRSGSSTTPDGTYTYEVYESISTARTWVTNWNTKWYLSALPSDEIKKNYGLIQNPGW